MNKLDYTEEEYKEMCAKLNQFKSTRSIVDRDVLTKQFCDVFHIAENSLIKFFKKLKSSKMNVLHILTSFIGLMKALFI